MDTLQILYLAFGYRYLVMAINSALSARRAGTLCHIKLLTNLPLKSVKFEDQAPFDEIVFLKSSNRANRYAKVQIPDFADGTSSLYLDCDTEVQYPLHKFVPVLSKFDVALRPIPYATKWDFAVSDRTTSKDTAISEFNAGVFFFSNTPGTKELFSLWERYFRQMGFDRDQPSLLKAFIETKTTRLFPLGTGWNAIPGPKHDLEFIRDRPEDIKITHYKGGPKYWPSAGPCLAHVHRFAAVEFSERGAKLEKEIEEFATVARYFEQSLFRYQLGRRFIDWRLKRNGRPLGLRMKGERDKSQAKIESPVDVN